ncbi:MAG: GNAT family N-acetyltransferase [Candidatus Latescibacteria bacterium]|nr:GNAT family N-acetyltransferase [Candidatus Latescibacterota bacterium]
MISYDKLSDTDLAKLAEIDRSETIRLGYEVHEGKLVEKAVVWDSPGFAAEGEGEHSVAGQIAFCRSHMACGATALGAFEHEVLVGIGLFTPDIRPAMAQLAYLYVSREYRRLGIAGKITRRLLEIARDLGSERVYVSSTPSESAVGFYRSFGFELADEPVPELLALEPEDIHMILELGPKRPDGRA